MGSCINPDLEGDGGGYKEAPLTRAFLLSSQLKTNSLVLPSLHKICCPQYLAGPSCPFDIQRLSEAVFNSTSIHLHLFRVERNSDQIKPRACRH